MQRGGDRDGCCFFASLVTSVNQRASSNGTHGHSTSWKLAIRRHTNLLFGAFSFLLTTTKRSEEVVSLLLPLPTVFFSLSAGVYCCAVQTLPCLFLAHFTHDYRHSCGLPFAPETSLSSSFSVATTTTTTTATKALSHTHSGRCIQSKAEQRRPGQKQKAKRAQERGQREKPSHTEEAPTEKSLRQPGYCSPPVFLFVSFFPSLSSPPSPPSLSFFELKKKKKKKIVRLSCLCASLKLFFDRKILTGATNRKIPPRDHRRVREEEKEKESAPRASLLPRS